jgi:repressor LexA
MTPAQRELVDAVERFWAENGFPPTVRELCEMTGRSSTSTIHAHLLRLQKAGIVEWRPGRQRTLRVLT